MGSTPAIRTSINKAYDSVALGVNMQVIRTSKSMFLVVLMLLASLSGCFGEEETVQEGVPIVFQIDYQQPSEVVMKSGEWHEFQLLGNGRAISVPTDVMLFVDGYIIPNGYALGDVQIRDITKIKHINDSSIGQHSVNLVRRNPIVTKLHIKQL